MTPNPAPPPPEFDEDVYDTLFVTSRGTITPDRRKAVIIQTAQRLAVSLPAPLRPVTLPMEADQ